MRKPVRQIPVLMPLFLSGCAAAALPPELERPTRCVYEVLQTSQGIEDPTVYYFGDADVVIAFGYRDNKGEVRTAEIFVGLRPLDGTPIAAGEYAGDPNLSRLLLDRLTTQCRINTGYTDQVVVMSDRRWNSGRIDMSKAAK